jgi:hypothetical protein
MGAGALTAPGSGGPPALILKLIPAGAIPALAADRT